MTDITQIGIIGIGKLGLCFALNLERSGFKVYATDIDPKYLASLENKTFHSDEPDVNVLLDRASNFILDASLQTFLDNPIKDIFVMVATPTSADNGYDHSQLNSLCDDLIAFGRQPAQRHLYIGCTTMPGYCSELAEKLEPYNWTVSYNPEFIAQGTVIYNQRYPDQVLIGEANVEVGDRLQSIYSKMVQNAPTYCRMDVLSAEITKLATNCFLTTKISFANSIGDLAKSVGADPDKILKAVGSDSRIGDKYLNYGFGFGGPCFPRDNRALGQFAKTQGQQLHISAATDEVNKQHLNFQIQDILKSKEEDAPIEFQTITYKPSSVLLEESQQLALAVALAKRGRTVVIYERPSVIKKVEEMYPGLFVFKEYNT